MSSEQGTASAVSSATPSPQPLHNPSQAAVVQPPQAPLGAPKVGATVVGAGHKALLAKKMAKSRCVCALLSPLRLWRENKTILPDNFLVATHPLYRPLTTW